MRSSFLLYAFASVTLAACSGDDSSGGGAACSDSMDCPEISCVCGDGTKGSGSECMFRKCAQAATFCDDMYCHDHGGTTSATEKPRQSVVGTPECNAYCAKITALQCASGPAKCNEKFQCAVGDGQCPASVRAKLQCDADTGTFQCTQQGWYSSSSCPAHEELCAEQDGGTADAATE